MDEASTEELLRVAEQCNNKLRERAAELRRSDPRMSRDESFWEAYRQLPQTVKTLNDLHNRLLFRGIALPPVR
jgi:hypothetical protein